ncbi:MAG TPA: putative porin [Aliidongia sp.]|nr:putative porin [Aliidongia sp.]
MTRRMPARPAGRKRRFATAAAIGALMAGLTAAPGFAQTAPTASDNVTLNLIRLLVQQKIITATQAKALIAQAEQQAASARPAPAPVAAAATPLAPPTVGQPIAGQALAGQPAAPGAPSGSVHVTYVPEIVKQQLRDEIKQEVLQQAKAENWAQPEALPDWTKRIHFYGDFRLRYEMDQFDPHNSANFFDFNTINSGSGLEFNPASANFGQDVPVLNSTEDRNRLRVRARLGLTADINDDFTVGFELGTGNNLNPGTQNQTLGNNFDFFGVVIDQAYLNYHPINGLNIWGGRMPNPWFATDLLWADDLTFDGVAVQWAQDIGVGLSPFVTAGAFPLSNTAINFPSIGVADTSDNQQGSWDRWLYAVQAGTEWRPSTDMSLKAAAAYYYFNGIEGAPSAACNNSLNSAAFISCSTDQSKAGFLQFGNTVFPIRNFAASSNAAGVALTEPELFGLASPFHVLALTGRFDYAASDPVHVIVDAEFADNLAFNFSREAALNFVNNFNDNNQLGTGNRAYMARITVGHPKVRERWDWDVMAAYKYLEADSVVSSFNDQDFHLGGTNAKGYIVGGDLGLAHNVWLTAKWYSATEVSGPPLAIDVLHLDLNARF